MSEVFANSSSAHDPYAALRHRDFRRFLSGSMLATIGNEMQTVAVGWELYERTRSPLPLGLVGLAQALPVILLALPAGHVADRVSRKWMIMTAQVALGVVSLGLWFVSSVRGPVALVYFLMVLAGTAVAFAFPARQAIVPHLVPRSVFANAVTWRSSGWQISAVIGPAIGGLGIGLYRSATPVYLADALIGLCVLGLIGGVATDRRGTSAGPLTWRSLLAGVRFVGQTELILASITLDMFAVLLGGAVTLLPIFARDILRTGPVGLGWLRAAPSLGALVMALALAHRPPLRRAGPALLASVAGFGFATIIFGLSRNAYLSFAMLWLTGAFDNISVVIRSTLLQVLTPDEMRGRVSAVNGIFIGMSNELGGFESGVAARLVGTVASVVLGGIGCLVVVIASGIKWPELRRLDHLDQPPRASLDEPFAATPLDVEGHT